MRLPKILKGRRGLGRRHVLRRGFTLIEILVVLGIVALVLAVTPIFDMRSFKKESVGNEVRTKVQELQKARNEAMNGVDIENNLFERLTGNVEEEHEIVFKNGNNGTNFATITINHEGGIDW
jgi:prepilin-type N-terminal cleavage/methylation domain-containing protein